MSSTDRSRARHGRRLAATLAPLLALCGLAPAAANAAITPELETRLASAAPGERIPVVATLRDQVDPADFAGRRAALVRALRTTARTSDVAAEQAIDGEVRHFWLVNALAADVTADEARILAGDPEVATVDLDSPVSVAAVPQPFANAGGGNWGLAAIDAPAVWTTYGITGAGVKIGNIDTGVDPSNPDLAGKVVGWRDFVSGQPNPYDDNGHGTHTAGTMVGGSAGGAPVGVAPQATVIVAKAMNSHGTGYGSSLLAAAEWMADPDGNPATADQPAVINNSWSASGPNDPWFRPMIQKWLALGIVPVFAAGNSGPTASTIGSPASYPEALAVGATAEDNGMASFSSRGPVVWQNPDGLGPAAGTPLTKPDVVAPGVAVTSTVGTGWLAYSGTSMASPHVAGIVALVKQADPALGGQALADVIRRTASDLGPAGPDATFGNGLVSASAAVAAVLGPAPETAFTATPPPVTNQKTVRYGVALSGASQFRFRVDGGSWSTPIGGTEMGLTLSEGDHVVEAQAVDARGIGDSSPARHDVMVDTIAPRASVEWRLRRGNLIYAARVWDAVSGVDPASAVWRFRDGTTASGLTVSRSLSVASPSAVTLTVRDQAGNPVTTTTGPATWGRTRPIRAVAAARRVSRRARAIVVRGRLSRNARVIATLERASVSQASVAASGPARVAHAATVRRCRKGTFKIRVPVRRVAPGAYRLVLSATGRNGSPLGAPVVRRIRVTA